MVDGISPLRAIEGDQHYPVANVCPNFDPYHDGNCTSRPAERLD